MTCLRKYADFRGRASRSEFVPFALFYVAGAFAIFWVTELGVRSNGLLSAHLMLVYLATLFLPFMASGWRRFHVLGRTGLPMLIPFAILFAGIAVSLIEGTFWPREYSGLVGAVFAYVGFLLTGPPIFLWLLFPSQSGSNEYGLNPHEVTQ